MAAELSEDDRQAIRHDFGEAVNMTPAELERWLATDASKAAGWGEGETVGHASGRRIVDIKRTKQADLDASDFEHMRKVVAFVHRHLAQGGPQRKADVADSRWRHSLMNWGHDPLEDRR
jgi:Protein of unknown function (DUF3140)